YADFGVAPDVARPQTWQVPRAEFDELLLRHAAASGADVRERHRIVDVAFDDAGVSVTVQPPDGARPQAVRAQGIVDAAGRAGLFAGMEHADSLDRAIAETPAVAGLLASARREWPVRVEKDFSFGSRAYAGDRWILAGDAGSFLDPVFSTGVAIALESGLEAA